MSGSYLLITVRMLNGHYHGRDHSGEPEWPPSPGRLFQSLVAVAGERRTDAQTAALRWLELQPPPTIDAPQQQVGLPRRSYVPNNDADQHNGESSRILKVVRPIHVSSKPAICYAWPTSLVDRDLAAEVVSLARRLRALGWGIDTAIGSGEFVDTLEPTREALVRWLPHPQAHSETTLRVPRRDTLAGLEADHRAMQQRIEGGTQTLTDRSARFDRVAYRTEHDLSPRPIRTFELVNAQGEFRSFWPNQVKELVAMLRHQAHETAKRAGWSPSLVSGYVCGHGEKNAPPPDDRVSFLPLPSIGMRHTDGFIRRVALAGSPGGDPQPLNELADRLIGCPLTPEGNGAVVAVLSQLNPRDRVAQRYHTKSSQWASVTPVVLPGFNARGRQSHERQQVHPTQDVSTLSGRARRTHKLVLRTLDEAGIPADALEDVWLQKLPLWPHLPRADQFDLPAYLRERPSFHVRLIFKQPVHGPITLGAGRFVGLGTFAAIPG